MTPIATFIMATAVSLMTNIGASAQTEPRLQLVCDDSVTAAFCRALVAAFETEFGPVVVSQYATDGMTSVRFVTEKQGRDMLTGHLAWQRADGGTGTGPTLTLSVSDAALNDAILDRFAIDLLRFSKLPL